MKKQINPTIKAHLIRGAFYLLLLVAVCAIPFALAQRNTAAGKMSRMVSRMIPRSHIPALAPASAFRVPAPKLPNAKGKNGIVRSLLAHTPLFTYMIDDGTAEDSVGLTAGGSLVALNSFPVSGGNNVITSISIAFGTPLFPDPTLNGLPYTAVLWSDPNGDGSPTDAVVLAMAPGVVSQAGTDTFITTTIPPTMVTTANFFVGFLITHVAGQFPAAFDETAPTLPNRSWVDATANINDLSGAITIESAGLVGNWLIRAEGQGGGTPSPTPSPTCGGPAAWQPGPDQSPARYALQAALGTDNMLYIAGGLNADNTTNYDQVSRYDYTTNTWSNVASLPVPLSQGTMGALNGKIYVVGGFIGGTSVSNALYIYDIATNTWTSGANMPTSPGVEAAAGAVVNGKFYVMGGDDFNNGLNTNFIYDIATNTWTTGATLPDNRTNTYATAYNGLIYVYGGLDISTFTAVDDLLLYDPVANSWTNLGSAGTGGFGNYGGISPFGTDQLLITDGADGGFSPTSATHIFTISSGTFSAGPAMLGNRAAHAQGTLPDGRVLVADGLNTSTTTVSTVELLTTPPPCASPTPTATATATATPTATVEPRTTPTPRPRPTPAPRP